MGAPALRAYVVDAAVVRAKGLRRMPGFPAGIRRAGVVQLIPKTGTTRPCPSEGRNSSLPRYLAEYPPISPVMEVPISLMLPPSMVAIPRPSVCDVPRCSPAAPAYQSMSW
ncbi:hypothetical protein DNK56_17815 [Streptomyces sp. AC1-42W]|nr:hypothetical protein DNK56_17815 [Streptomyces sp. AC1-42W]